MKHLQLTPPLLIVTMGYPGAGKTFFARQFADLYSLARISEDRIRYELFEKPLFNTDEAEIINRMQNYMLEQAMQTERTIIAEGSYLNFAQRQEVYQLARSSGYRTLAVWLQTDVQTSASRAANRDRRNIDSKYSFALERDTFEDLRDKLQRPHEKEVSVVISGKHAFKSQCLTVLRKIASMYSDVEAASTFTVPSPSVPVLRPHTPRSSNGRLMIQ